jgi:hypothetical protein
MKRRKAQLDFIFSTTTKSNHKQRKKLGTGRTEMKKSRRKSAQPVRCNNQSI